MPLAIAIATLVSALFADHRRAGNKQPHEIYEQLVRQAAKAGDMKTVKWMRTNRNQVLHEIWKAMPAPTQTLWQRFHDKGAPSPGDRGYREPPAEMHRYATEPTGEARSLLDWAIHEIENPETMELEAAPWEQGIEDETAHSWFEWEIEQLYGLFERSEMSGYPAPHDDEDWQDWLDEYEAVYDRYHILDRAPVNSRDADGTPRSIQRQIGLVLDTLDVAAELSPETARSWWEPGWFDRWKRDEGGTYPRWLVEAAMADALDPDKTLRLVPVSREVARDFISRHHRFLPDWPYRTMYAVGARKGRRLVAVATAGHPTGRWADQTNVLELTRIASDATVKNASSMLAARLLDLTTTSARGDPLTPTRFVTYSLISEPGHVYKSLADKGLKPVLIGSKHAKPGGRRKKVKALADVDKIRWEAGPGAGEANWSLLDKTDGRPIEPLPEAGDGPPGAADPQLTDQD